MAEPRELAERAESAALPPWADRERFAGYGVMGLPFASGHVLGMRRFPASSVGPGYTSVWHRSPAGDWTFYSDVEPLQSCNRFFGSAVETFHRTPIALEWTGPRSLRIEVATAGLAWESRFASSPATRLSVTPDVRRESVGSEAGHAVAYLRVQGQGMEQLRSCYGRISHLVWAMTHNVNGEQRTAYFRQSEGRDVYFKWQGASGRYHNFHREAILEIARARYGDGQGGWAAHAETPAPRSISYFEDYYLSVEIAAENIPSQLVHFRLKLYSQSWKNEDGSVTLEPMGTPPHFEFERIEERSIPATEQRSPV